MNMDSGQIDRIVREVMRQLMSLDIAQSDRVPAADAAPALTPQTLVVTDRVITMASLSGRLVGITRLQVPSRAVVTPLVSDLLREQGIQLDRQSQAPPNNAGRAVSIVLVADDTQTPRVAECLNQLATPWQRCLRPEEAFLQVVDAAADRRAIILTSNWANIVCQANRNPQLRASAVHSVQSVRQACQQLDANVVVIDASQLRSHPLQEIVREFVTSMSTRALGPTPTIAAGPSTSRQEK